jgi:hypothetical protein
VIIELSDRTREETWSRYWQNIPKAVLARFYALLQARGAVQALFGLVSNQGEVEPFPPVHGPGLSPERRSELQTVCRQQLCIIIPKAPSFVTRVRLNEAHFPGSPVPSVLTSVTPPRPYSHSHHCALSTSRTGGFFAVWIPFVMSHSAPMCQESIFLSQLWPSKQGLNVRLSSNWHHMRAEQGDRLCLF